MYVLGLPYEGMVIIMQPTIYVIKLVSHFVGQCVVARNKFKSQIDDGRE